MQQECTPQGRVNSPRAAPKVKRKRKWIAAQNDTTKNEM